MDNNTFSNFKISIDELYNQDERKIHNYINELIKTKYGFSPSNAMKNTFMGPNIMGNTPPIKPNNNLNGYIFTVRPDLNLSFNNINIVRKLVPLLTNDENSMMRALRIILSPRIGEKPPLRAILGRDLMSAEVAELNTFNLKSNLVDNQYPFIAISDNLVKSLSGWPSGQLGIRTTTAGILKENHIMASAPATFNGEYSLNLSTLSMQGDPILFLYYYWILYISAVFSMTYGPIPWPDYFVNGRMDYTTRIYRLIMDETNTYVREMAATGWAIPRAIDIGPHFNFDSEDIHPFVSKTVEIEFACTGAIYLDEILIKQFNQTVCMFNPNMLDGTRDIFMVQVDKKYYKIFNYNVYPRIDPITKELQWWIYKEKLSDPGVGEMLARYIVNERGSIDLYRDVQSNGRKTTDGLINEYLLGGQQYV